MRAMPSAASSTSPASAPSSTSPDAAASVCAVNGEGGGCAAGAVESRVAAMPDTSYPLAGIRIIDLMSNMSGPLATMVLADQGADVVKIEPPSGDAIRTVGSGHDGMSAYFANNNRGKRSIAIDLSTET